MESNIIIAVDGTAASGKGTLASNLAKHYNFHALDTGLVYRAAGYEVMQKGLDVSNHDEVVNFIKNIEFKDFSNPYFLTEDVGSYASKIAVIQGVRDVLNVFFREYVANVGNCVVDGRDIGTVVFPQAQIKIYVTARVEVRSQRRFKQLQNAGKSIIYESVLEDLKVRDERDTSRKVAPLKPALDSIYIDTSDLEASSVLDLAVSLTSKFINSKLAA